MKTEKGKNIVIVVLMVIILVLSVMLVLTLTGKVDFNFGDDIVDKTETNDNNENKYDESDLIRDTSVILVDEVCSTKPISANIVDGDIVLSSSEKTLTIATGNAKYLYRTAHMACDNTYLFFITETGNLYLLSGTTILFISDDYQNGDIIPMTSLYNNLKKLSNVHDNIVGFIDYGRDVLKDEYGYSPYDIKVLDKNGEEKSFTYIYTVLP